MSLRCFLREPPWESFSEPVRGETHQCGRAFILTTLYVTGDSLGTRTNVRVQNVIDEYGWRVVRDHRMKMRGDRRSLAVGALRTPQQHTQCVPGKGEASQGKAYEEPIRGLLFGGPET